MGAELQHHVLAGGDGQQDALDDAAAVAAALVRGQALPAPIAPVALLPVQEGLVFELEQLAVEGGEGAGVGAERAGQLFQVGRVQV